MQIQLNTKKAVVKALWNKKYMRYTENRSVGKRGSI